jgi:outer membrane protein assembly factor BamE (lipoprotein component of BamABCDE complex)
MSLENKKPEQDIFNIEFDDDAQMKKVVFYGKTTGGDFVPLLVDANGDIQ